MNHLVVPHNSTYILEFFEDTLEGPENNTEQENQSLVTDELVGFEKWLVDVTRFHGKFTNHARGIYKIHNNVMWDRQYSTKYSLHSGWMWEYSMEHCQSHKTLLWIWVLLCRIYIELIKKNRKIANCKWLVVETLGYWLIMPKNLPNHCHTVGKGFAVAM